MQQTEIITRARSGAIRQFSIYADNKVGRLNDMIRALAREDIHIMAISTLDTTDSAVIRLVVDYTEKAFEVLVSDHFSFNVVEVLGVEIETEQEMRRVTGPLIEAEINIHYLYPFIMRPSGKSGLVLRLEDNDLAAEVLRRYGVKVLSEHDIAR